MTLSNTQEPGQDLSLPPYICYHGCGFECDGDDWDRQNNHINWHTMLESRILTLEQMIRSMEGSVNQRVSEICMLQIAIRAIEQVIGTTGNFNFVEKNPVQAPPMPVS